MSELKEPTKLDSIKEGDSLYYCKVTMKVLVDTVTTFSVKSEETKVIAREGNIVRTDSLQFELDPEYIDQPGAVLPAPEGEADENSPMLIALGTNPGVVEYIVHQVVQKVFINPEEPSGAEN